MLCEKCGHNHHNKVFVHDGRDKSKEILFLVILSLQQDFSNGKEEIVEDELALRNYNHSLYHFEKNG